MDALTFTNLLMLDNCVFLVIHASFSNGYDCVCLAVGPKCVDDLHDILIFFNLIDTGIIGCRRWLPVLVRTKPSWVRTHLKNCCYKV